MRRVLIAVALVLLFLAPSAFATSDLSIKYEGPPLIDRGRGSVGLTVRNDGPDNTTSTHIAVNASVPAICDGCARTFLTAKLSTSVVLHFSPTIEPGTVLTISASIAGEGFDPDTSNNSTTFQVTVVDQPDLFVQARYPSTADPDTATAYIVSYGNASTNLARDTTLAIDLPDGTNVTKVDGADCIVSGSHLNCSIGLLPGGTSGGDSRTLLIHAVNPARFDGPAASIAAHIRAAGQGDLNPDDNDSVINFALTKVILVTNANDDGDGSLRRAIETVNSGDGTQKIAFQIVAPPFTIAPRSPLPAITRAVEVDGAWQTKRVGGRIVLDGANVATGSGLTSNVPCFINIHDLTIRGFFDNGILVTSNEPCPPQQIDFVIGQVRNCTLTANGLRGVAVFLPGTTQNIFWISGNDASGNLRSGIFAASGPRFSISLNRLDGNGASGVYVAATGSSIGNNTITNNRDFGVAIDGAAQYVDVRGNSMSGNGQLGIDVGLNGPGGGLEPPRLTSASYDPATGKTTITGTYPPLSRRYSYGLITDIYTSDGLSHSHAEGQKMIYSASIFPGQFTLHVDGDFTGKIITATATVTDINTFGGPRPAPLEYNPYGIYTETSEFSEGILVK